MEKAKHWFVGVLGLEVIEDRGELIFLLAGPDVLALKTPRMAVSKPEHGDEKDRGNHRSTSGWQTLDHYGFYASSPEQVDAFAKHVESKGAKILKGPYDRSDGRSVYFKDPCDNVGEYLFFKPKDQSS